MSEAHPGAPTPETPVSEAPAGDQNTSSIMAESRFILQKLNNPIVRGEQKIEKVNLRKPRAGEMRGLALQDVLTTDITAILTLIPRVTDPPLTREEADALEADDFAEMGALIRSFFLTTAERSAIESFIAEHQPRT